MQERLPENLLGFQVAFWRWLGFRGSGLARFRGKVEQKRMNKTGQPPLQAGLIYPSAGETDFLVRLIIEMCLAGNFIGLRAKNTELVTADTMLG